MPIPSPGNYDNASQITLLAVKAKTDLLTATPADQAKLDTSLYTSRLAPVVVTAAIGAVNVNVDLQPPAGEIWDVLISAGISTAAATSNLVNISYFDGATSYTVVGIGVVGLTANAGENIGVQARMRLTNALYCRIRFSSGQANNIRMHAYWGWKE